MKGKQRSRFHLPKTGIIALVVLFIVLVFLGWAAFTAPAHTPEALEVVDESARINAPAMLATALTLAMLVIGERIVSRQRARKLSS